MMTNQELTKQLINCIEEEKSGWTVFTRSDQRYIDGYNRCVRLVKQLLKNYIEGK